MTTTENDQKTLHPDTQNVTLLADGVPVDGHSLDTNTEETMKTSARRKLDKPAGFKGGIFIFPKREGLDRVVSDFLELCLYRAAGEDVAVEEVADLLKSIPVIEMPSLESVSSAPEINLSRPRLRRILEGLGIKSEYQAFCKKKKAIARANARVDAELKKIDASINKKKEKRVIRRRQTTA